GESHYYAKGFGWVGWQESDAKPVMTWNQGRTDKRYPKDNCGGLSTWPGSFRDTSTTRNTAYGDWDFCRGKMTCQAGEGIGGVSEVAGDYGRNALCRRGAGYTGDYRATLTTDGASDARRATRNGDWAPGYWKLECGADEYVAAVSENANQCQGNRRFH